MLTAETALAGIIEFASMAKTALADIEAHKAEIADLRDTVSALALAVADLAGQMAALVGRVSALEQPALQPTPEPEPVEPPPRRRRRRTICPICPPIGRCSAMAVTMNATPAAHQYLHDQIQANLKSNGPIWKWAVGSSA